MPAPTYLAKGTFMQAVHTYFKRFVFSCMWMNSISIQRIFLTYLVPTIFLLHLDFIRCDFETDYCDWHTTQSGDFRWERHTADSLEAAEVDGPPADHDGEKDKYFVYSNGGGTPASRLSEDVASIESQGFNVDEHPVECLRFYYYLKVSLSYGIRYVGRQKECLKIGPLPASFFVIIFFCIRWIVNKICRLLDLNRRSLVSDLTALPTVPQPPSPFFQKECLSCLIIAQHNFCIASSKSSLSSLRFKSYKASIIFESFNTALSLKQH